MVARVYVFPFECPLTYPQPRLSLELCAPDIGKNNCDSGSFSLLSPSSCEHSSLKILVKILPSKFCPHSALKPSDSLKPTHCDMLHVSLIRQAVGPIQFSKLKEFCVCVLSSDKSPKSVSRGPEKGTEPTASRPKLEVRSHPRQTVL